MTKIVVDASVLVACALSDGKARRTLFQASGAEFYAPEFVLDELKRKFPKILAISRVAPAVLAALIDDRLGRVSVVPRQGYAIRMEEALRLTVAANARGDEDYVALALVLDAPIWTYDKDFKRVKGIKVATRDQFT